MTVIFQKCKVTNRIILFDIKYQLVVINYFIIIIKLLFFLNILNTYMIQKINDLFLY